MINEFNETRKENVANATQIAKIHHRIEVDYWTNCEVWEIADRQE